MAQEFREATQAMREHAAAIDTQADRLRRAFHVDDSSDKYVYQPSFDVRFSYAGHQSEENLDRIIADMKRDCWAILVDALGIKNVMSVADRAKFEKQMREDNLPDITEEAIGQIIMGLADQAEDFAKKAAREVFDILRPGGHWSKGNFKTNDTFRVGRKVILTWMVERGYSSGRFRVNYNHAQKLTAIDGVFHLLDGKGVMRENMGPLVAAINASETGNGETEYFSFKCFKKGTLHLTMKRLDLVQELNKVATGEYVLGDDMKE